SPRRLMVTTTEFGLFKEEAERISDPKPGTVAGCVRHPHRPREMYTPRLLHALRRLDRAQQLAESRRLFYVAATRAKERLILAGQQFANPARMPESWQKWFEEALGLTEQHKKSGFWQDAGKGYRVNIITEAAGGGLIAERKPNLPDMDI